MFGMASTQGAGLEFQVARRPIDVPALDLTALLEEDYESDDWCSTESVNSTASPPSSPHQFSTTDPEHLGLLQKQLQLLFTYATISPLTPLSQRKAEADSAVTEKMKAAVMEQIMMDQLSRAVISNPEQNKKEIGPHGLPTRQRVLHDTRVNPRSALTENLLLHKMCFDARLITRCGREACRELFGFFFAFDRSLTVYEYRHFGKNRCCILPFVPRGKYTHQIGSRSHQPYALCDLYVGADLTFTANDLPCLPQALRSCHLLTIRITDLDQGARDRIMRDFTTDLLTTNQENKGKKLPPPLYQDTLRPHTLASLLCLGPLLSQAAGSGHITKPLIASALQASGLHLTEQKFAVVWSYVTQATHSSGGYDAVLRGLRGNMTENRKAMVRKAYVMLDPNKVGAISTSNILKFYAARGRPPALPGEIGEVEVRAALLRILKLVFKDPQSITYGEFDDLHEVLSLGITDDSRFASLMRVTWGI